MDNKNQTVPIVFAVNNNYAPYLYVCLKSLIKNAKSDVNYNIYVLYTGLEKRHRKNLVDLTSGNIRVECINVEKYMEGINLRGGFHITVETYYRFLIAEIFTEYSKVLYIDCDTLILDDVFDLYSCSLHGNIVGAIHDVVCGYLKEHYEQHVNMDVCDAFNAGIMLIDTVKFREKKIKDKCMKILHEDSKADERKYLYMDQDVLNL
ncbi:MAG: glycosyltransferase family 8 protein, partial [Oscillospiraceae bacterium]|nr:glycosyltransferase family 8 protein [Oscillospiraceae bacterium]